LGISNTVAFNCNDSQYHFFRQNKKGYAYSGLLGRVAPIVVHISIIILLLGSTVSSFVGYTAQEIVPRGEIFHVQNLTKFGNISYIPQNFYCRINNFWITYTNGLKTDQFYSDLSVFDQKGNEVKRKIIFVNNLQQHSFISNRLEYRGAEITFRRQKNFPNSNAKSYQKR